MTDDVLLNKAATIGRCVSRIRQEYDNDPQEFARNHTRQDAAILNIQRAIEASLDMGHHLIRRDRLGIPQSSRDVFSLLQQNGYIETDLCDSLRRMVGFRNIAVHDYASFQLPIVQRIIECHLEDFLTFSQTTIRHSALNQRN